MKYKVKKKMKKLSLDEVQIDTCDINLKNFKNKSLLAYMDDHSL